MAWVPRLGNSSFVSKGHTNHFQSVSDGSGTASIQFRDWSVLLLTNHTVVRTSVLLAAFLGLLCNVLSGQSSLALSSGSAAADGSVSLNLTLASPAGSEPAGIQWTFAYPAASVANFSVVAGPALTSAGKSLTCAGSASAYMCLASGNGTKLDRQWNCGYGIHDGHIHRGNCREQPYGRIVHGRSRRGFVHRRIR